MKINQIKQILTTLDRNTFERFVFEFFSSDDGEKKDMTQKTNIIENGLFEQLKVGWSNIMYSNRFKSYNYILPFYYPLELFKNLSSISLINSEVLNKLKKTQFILEQRKKNWTYWDGKYEPPDIAFITNFEGLETNVYQQTIIPQFQKIVDQSNIDAEAIVGSFDTFFFFAGNKVIETFNSFISKYQKQVSIVFRKDKLELEYFKQDKYLTESLLKNSNSPYEPVFIERIKKKYEIVKEFEFLINNDVSESKLEIFLAKYYKEIFGEQYDRIETQLWLKFPELDISQKNRRLDMFLRNSVQGDWELFELKKTMKIVRSYRNIPAFTAEINNGIQQLRNYQQLLKQDRVKRKFAKEGIEYYHPELRLVVGRKPDISLKDWRFLKSTNENNIKIITFDELLLSLKKRYTINEFLKIEL